MKVLRWVGVVFGFFCLGGVIAFISITPDFEVPATIMNNKNIPRIVIDGTSFHGEVYGQDNDPVVIVIHGGPGSDYRSLLPLKELVGHGYRVVFYDQRGAGLSPRVPIEQITLDNNIEDLNLIVDHFGNKQPVALVGHSWGGILGAYYINKYPHKVARAVLAEPGVLTSEEMQKFIPMIQPKLSLSMVTKILTTILASFHVDEPDEQASIDYVLMNMMYTEQDNPLNRYWCNETPPKKGAEFWRSGALAMQGIMQESQQPDGKYYMPPLDNIDAYTDEVLFIASRCNALIGIDLQQQHCKFFPHASLEIIENSGHMMFGEQPQQSLQAVLHYFMKTSW